MFPLLSFLPKGRKEQGTQWERKGDMLELKAIPGRQQSTHMPEAHF